LDRSKIETVGKPAIGRFLTQMSTFLVSNSPLEITLLTVFLLVFSSNLLVVYKATANCRAATELFAKLTSVDEHFSSIRKIVIGMQHVHRHIDDYARLTIN
jgi:hypothetical protein